MNAYIERALDNVACNTGRNLLVVERVFVLMEAVQEYGHALVVKGDNLTEVPTPETIGSLPSDLVAEVKESYEDILELLGPIMRALH